MRLLIIRHAIAEDRAEFAAANPGEADGARPLTRRGRARMKRGALGLATVMSSVDLLATSPHVRAVQTAKIVARRMNVRDVEIREELVPEASPAKILDWLRTRAPHADSIALVGHEPHLGRLVGWLLAAKDRSPLALKKGGALLLEVPRRARPGSAKLAWAMTPRQLRALAR